MNNKHKTRDHVCFLYKHVSGFALLMLICLVNACGTKAKQELSTDSGLSATDTTTVKNIQPAQTEPLTDELATYYILIADTDADYDRLNKKMFELNSLTGIPIDTMRRSYNKKKNLIALPENDEDEIYAGEYFPRRFPSAYYSLEYLRFYKTPSEEKTIALVTGIYESEPTADSAFSVLKKIEKNAFKIKASIYIGCIH